VEERSGKEDIEIHLRPADGVRKRERNLRGLESMLRKAANVGMVVKFRRRGFKKSCSGVYDSGDE